MSRNDIPEVMKPFYFDFHWSQKKLWGLSLPVETMKVCDFKWLLEYPIWATNPPDAIFDLCPIDVIRRPDLYPVHQKRIANANCEFPIHIMYFKGRWIILDGFHRLIKLIEEKQREIQVMKVSVSMIPDLAPDANSPSGFAKHEGNSHK